MTDRDLLDRFLSGRDEESFAELVRRHGPGVWGACRRRLTNPHDAEDAFQAAFLVLVRRAGRLRAGTPLGPWLGKVAALTARNVARGNRRRAAVSGPMDHDIAAVTASESPVDLDAALLGLPEADRAAVVLCHLDGLTRKEAAERLGCPEGTLSARLSRALAKLRQRLADEIPPGLVRSTVRVAVVFGVAGGSAGVSPAVARLTEEAIRMLWVKKLTAAGLILAATGMIGLGVAGTAGAGGQDKGAEPEVAAKANKPAADKVAELEKAVRELREENRRLREQQAAMTGFIRNSLQSPEVAAKPKDPPAGEVAEWEKRAREADEAVLAAKLKVELAEREREFAIKRLDVARREKAGGAAPKDAEADLKLSIGPNAEWEHQYQIEERTPGGVIRYGTTVPPGLPVLLARAKADPNGPKTVHVQAEESCKPGDIRAGLLALKAAGFKTASYTGPLEGNLHGAAKGPGAWVYDKAKRYTGPIDLADLPAPERK